MHAFYAYLIFSWRFSKMVVPLERAGTCSEMAIRVRWWYFFFFFVGIVQYLVGEM